MKKYWRIIVITAIIIVSAGTFYIQSTISANNLPQFSIEKISGDEQEIESLVLSGMYQETDSPAAYEYMELDSDGSLYFRQQSFFKRMDDWHYPTLQLATLFKDHRSFMRGKGWSNSVIEDKRIVHVDMIYRYDRIINNKFVISILDKKTNKQTTFDHNIQLDGADGWVDILKIQVKDDQLKVVTENDAYENGQQKREIHLYTFDLSAQTLVNEEELFQLSNEQSSNSSISTNVLDSTGASDSGRTIAFLRDTSTHTTDDEGFIIDETVEHTLIVYDLETEGYTEIDVEEMIDYGDPQFYDDEHIYFTDIDPEKGANVHTYSLVDKKVIDTLTIDQSKGFHGPHMTMEGGKLILVNVFKDVKTPAYITVIDLETKETLYQGEIVHKDMKENFEFDIHAIGFK